jgi:hypothetical protein
MAENFVEIGDFHVILGSFTCRKARHDFLSEGRRAQDFFARKIRGFGRVSTRELGYQRPARYP